MRHVVPPADTKPAVSLRAVLAYIEEHGWGQGERTGQDYSACVGYALQIVGGGMCSPAGDAIRAVIGQQNIVAWNDRRETDIDAVRSAILKAIEKETVLAQLCPASG